jgi:hypothetical protein
MIGGDPEVFLIDRKSGSVVPSCDLIGGTKDKPIPFYRNYSWLEDNVALEFNFQPVSRYGDFGALLQDLKSRARDFLAVKGLEMFIAPSYKFKKEALNNPKALSIGCSPDTCAYDGNKKRVVDIDSLGTHRFCGGHIHLSYSKKERIPSFAVAMLMDALVGLPSIWLDAQGLRRAHYGIAGLYREKPYGVEYRTMSNWWLGANNDYPAYMALTMLGIGHAIEKTPLELSNLFSIIPFKDVQSAINNEDKKLGYEVFRYIRSSAPLSKCQIDFSFGDLVVRPPKS